MKLPVHSTLSEKSTALCLHCGNPLSKKPRAFRRAQDLRFCCAGCESVYHFLTTQGLSNYYELKKQGWIRPAKPVEESHSPYTYLEDPAILKLYLSAEKNPSIEFYLEGIHCIACLWLIEKLPEFAKGVQSAKLHLGNSIVKITLNEDGSFAEVARLLGELGYKPHPLQKNTEAYALQKKENQRELIRMGIAGACTGNIMLMVVSLYGGASGKFGQLFSILSFVLFLPILFYAALPFYKNAWAALKTRSINIDVPIVLALVLGSVLSTWNLSIPNGHLYFDSLSALIFLLLASRYVLKRIQQNIFKSSQLLHFLTPQFAKRFNPETRTYETVRADLLERGDQIQVLENELFPADGKIEKGKSLVDSSLLTGEALPQKMVEGDEVFAGTRNQSALLIIEVTATRCETRLGKIIKEIESGNLQKAPIIGLADKISKIFVFSILILAMASFVFFAFENLGLAFQRALALLIVTCPCALALATPLTLSINLGRAAREGLLLKGAETLERLSNVKKIYLDKTGTLTEGSFEVLQWQSRDSSPSLKEAVLALEKKSKHPIAQAICRMLEEESIAPQTEVLNFQEQLGMGVSGNYQGDFYEVKSLPLSVVPNTEFAGLKTYIGVWKNSQCLAQILLGDSLRADSSMALSQLKKLGLEPYILSGDQETAVLQVAHELKIPRDHCYSRTSPEKKKEIVQGAESLMVGDGANDALALANAWVGVAVQGSMEVSLRAADVYSSGAGLKPVVRVLKIARENIKVLKRNFVFSILYNLVGATAALLGLINPLIAAVLMPLSSLTVFISALIGTRTLRKGEIR